MTVSGLMEMLEEQYGVELSMLSSGVTILYSDFMDRKKMAVSVISRCVLWSLQRVHLGEYSFALTGLLGLGDGGLHPFLVTVHVARENENVHLYAPYLAHSPVSICVFILSRSARA
jgi:hypothetical protein